MIMRLLENKWVTRTSTFLFVLFGLHFFFLAEPLHSNRLFIDYPDPKNPGHLTGITVSTAAFVIEIALLIVLLSVSLFPVLARMLAEAKKKRREGC